jgi:hypothetical protein
VERREPDFGRVVTDTTEMLGIAIKRGARLIGSESSCGRRHAGTQGRLATKLIRCAAQSYCLVATLRQRRCLIAGEAKREAASQKRDVLQKSACIAPSFRSTFPANLWPAYGRGCVLRSVASLARSSMNHKATFAGPIALGSAATIGSGKLSFVTPLAMEV